MTTLHPASAQGGKLSFFLYAIRGTVLCDISPQGFSFVRLSCYASCY